MFTSPGVSRQPVRRRAGHPPPSAPVRGRPRRSGRPRTTRWPRAYSRAGRVDRGDRGAVDDQRLAHDGTRAAARRTASRIFSYPVQRHRLPASASRTSASVAVGVAPDQVGHGDDQARACRIHTGPRRPRRRPAAPGRARPPRGEPLDGDDVAPGRLRRGDQARADRQPVQQHRARAALALLAGVLRAGQAEPLAQHEHQALARARRRRRCARSR